MAAYCDSLVLQIWDEIHRTILLTFVSEYLQRYALMLQKYNNKLHLASGLNLSWYGNMEWNTEKKF